MDPYAYCNAGSFSYPLPVFPLVADTYHANQNEIKFITMNPPTFEPSSTSRASSSHGSNATSPQEGKSRLRRACDSCSIRKVKCDEGGPPCQPCSALEIECTWQRPTRRRGPPNKHAEAMKRKKPSSPPADVAISPPLSSISAPSSTIGVHQSAPTAESICPWPLLSLLVDDYFVFIHPLIPFPHEPTFRTFLQNRDDIRDSKVLALLASMVGALVASFPRKARQHLKALRNEDLFPSSISLLERCQAVVAEARGPGYLDKDPTLFDALTSYLLGLTGGYTFRMQQGKLYFGECLSILRCLGLHRPGRTPISLGSPRDDEENSEDLIGREIGRRAFWVLFVGARSMQQLGGSITELFIPPETSAAPYPPLPLEVDDNCIFSDRIIPQPAGTSSELVGFNANVKIYRSYEALSVIDMTSGINSRMGWDWQRMLIKRALLACKHALDGLPTELKLTFGTYANFGQPDQMSPKAAFEDANSVHGDFNTDRRQKQYEIQKANLYVSQLGTRSHIVEKYWTLCEYDQQQSSWAPSPSMAGPQSPASPPPPLDGFEMTGARSHQFPQPPPNRSKELERAEMAEERENIIRDLLKVLSSISQVNMEPNGASVMFKIRMIASTLLDVPRTRKGALAVQADEYLARFLDILIKLERAMPVASVNRQQYAQGSGLDGKPGPGDTGHATMEADEEAELVHWADLGEYQEQFIKSGGFLG